MIDWTTALEVAGGLAGYLGTAVMGWLWQRARDQRDAVEKDLAGAQVVLKASEDDRVRLKGVVDAVQGSLGATNQRLLDLVEVARANGLDLAGHLVDGVFLDAASGQGDPAVPGPSPAAPVPGGQAKPVPGE